MPAEIWLSEEEMQQQYLSRGRLSLLFVVLNEREQLAALERLRNLQGGTEPLARCYISDFPVWLGMVGSEPCAVWMAFSDPTETVHAVCELLLDLCPLLVISVGVGWGNPHYEPPPQLMDVMVCTHLREFPGNARWQESRELGIQLESQSAAPPTLSSC